ncbi:MAG: metallophosphoesterase family protein [Planctomycetaceae bacterium]|nr:metallophosphoesterase family protein [Planctomycetaceae bacterium]
MMRIALLGGLYSNYLALEAALVDARRRGCEAIYCLGDLGAFGPHPDRAFPLLHEHGVACVRGNYDDSIGRELADCQCGYTDPRDNHFAQLSYDYTLANTSPANRAWLRSLPGEIRFDLGSYRVLLCHGSPRRTNEFLWESTTSTHFLEHLADEHEADVICGTHTGIKWRRDLAGGRMFVNVGVLGRPENDGRTNVWYTLLTHRRHHAPRDGILEKSLALCDPPHAKREDYGEIVVEFIPIEYDHQRLAAEMRAQRLPEEFIETIIAGWWTTCLEILPAKERRRGRW